MRTLCVRCMRSVALCYCARVRPFDVGFDLVILQHPRERKRTTATARMTHLCIRNSSLVVGSSFERDPQVNAWLADPSRFCVILYPGRDSVDLSSQAWSPSPGRRLTVFVLDGTWSTAKTLLARSPNLQALPQVRFTPVRQSEYGFRRQPRPECLSTIEAVHDLLEVLEPQSQRELVRVLVHLQHAYHWPRSKA